MHLHFVALQISWGKISIINFAKKHGIEGTDAAALAKLRALKVTADEVPTYVERVLTNFTEQRKGDEGFADWVERADEESLRTTKRGVFAGGDIVSGSATVILAMGAGRKAARSMHEYLETGEW